MGKSVITKHYYNVVAKSHFWGHYYSSLEDAIKDFERRY